MTTRKATENVLFDALAVIVLDATIRRWLRRIDPKALVQAEAALLAADAAFRTKLDLVRAREFRA